MPYIEISNLPFLKEETAFFNNLRTQIIKELERDYSRFLIREGSVTVEFICSHKPHSSRNAAVIKVFMKKKFWRTGRMIRKMSIALCGVVLKSMQTMGSVECFPVIVEKKHFVYMSSVET